MFRPDDENGSSLHQGRTTNAAKKARIRGTWGVYAWQYEVSSSSIRRRNLHRMVRALRLDKQKLWCDQVFGIPARQLAVIEAWCVHLQIQLLCIPSRSARMGALFCHFFSLINNAYAIPDRWTSVTFSCTMRVASLVCLNRGCDMIFYVLSSDQQRQIMPWFVYLFRRAGEDWRTKQTTYFSKLPQMYECSPITALHFFGFFTRSISDYPRFQDIIGYHNISEHHHGYGTIQYCWLRGSLGERYL